MAYAVKEIFYTLQGEGAHTGRPAVFLRFAGCNLWTGLERDRDKGPGGCSRWCDTDFVGTDGSGGGKFRSPADLVSAVASHWPHSDVQPFVVCTGGEPLLQLDAPLVEEFNSAGWFVAVETNGTVDPPAGKLWLTVSPKAHCELRVLRGNELKLVFPQVGVEPERFQDLAFEHFFLQPMDSPDKSRNTQQALQYCLAHPQWRLSLQTHKILNIP
ncbi:MAG TPA: 7-carboxy-7-deazaguanine synthase [Steroidobacteraceae bacterium]|nr:7-carboxy-7-deazaguanine synthase [Steroidobacteraceae bacterium]